MGKPSKRQLQNDVIQAANRLDPEDQSLRARQLRETAEDIKDQQGSDGAYNQNSN